MTTIIVHPEDVACTTCRASEDASCAFPHDPLDGPRLPTGRRLLELARYHSARRASAREAADLQAAALNVELLARERTLATEALP